MTVEEILGWADAYHERTGSWPTAASPGPVARGRDETWFAVERALNSGRRGLSDDGSLAQLLARADAFHARDGRWPNVGSGAVEGVPGENWQAIHSALVVGARGLPAGYTLATPLRKYRRNRGRRNLPPYTESAILPWADAFHRRHERWPTQQSGPIREARGETWSAVEAALKRGGRGLPGGDSLSRFLKRHGRRLHGKRPHHPARHTPLAIKQILAWADAFQRRHGKWPNCLSGPVAGAPGERWAAIHSVLEQGGRGLPSGHTLATLLEKYRGVPYKRALPRYTVRKILAWADAHHSRHGTWPSLRSGTIPEASGETWLKVDGALSKGRRGLPGGDSLSQLLIRHKRRPRRNRGHHPARHSRLTIQQILAWADEFHRREDRWPASGSGPIKGTSDETWVSVDNTLRVGMRGLQPGSSVALLLEERRGARHKHHRARLTNRDILAWADAHHRRTGRWPNSQSGQIPESTGDTWLAVENALRAGRRGRSGGDSLARFLRRHGRSC